jgi:hypothetical protein
MKHPEVQLVRPPVPVRPASAGSGFFSSARYRALAFFAHDFTPPYYVMLLTNDLTLNRLLFKNYYKYY